MPEPPEQASQRHANWIGLRTLRQRPKPTAAVVDGEPVYEAKSVRLVLRSQSPHFNRVTACERCGRDQIGVPLLTPADLDAPVRPMICSECVRKAGVSSVWEPDVPRAAQTQRPALAAAEARMPMGLVPASSGTVERRSEEPPPDEVDRRFQALAARLDELDRAFEAQQAGEERRRREDDAALSAVRAAMSQALTEVRRELATASGKNEARAAAFEAALREDVGALSGLVDALRADLAVVANETVQTRAEVQARLDGGVAAAAAAATRVGAMVEQRLDELAAQASARFRDIEERMGRLAEQLAAQSPDTSTPTTLPPFDSDAKNGTQLLDSLEAQLRGASSRLAALSAIPRAPSV